MLLSSCQDKATFLPDLYPETSIIEYLPNCNGEDGDCDANQEIDECCHVHRGLNWTNAVCKCREYGGDIATPYDITQDGYMFDFIEQIYVSSFWII
jgi:hypothetical protein